LPEIAAPEDRDRVSAKGFSYGYIGSVILQIVGFVLVLLITTNPFLAPRITFLLVGLWWAGFAQVTFAALPETRSSAPIRSKIIREGFSEMKKVYREIKQL